MPRDYPDDVGKQNFLAEVYDKERTAQLGWYFKKVARANNTQDGSSEVKSKQFEVFSRRIEAARCHPTPQLISLRQRRANELTNTDEANAEGRSRDVNTSSSSTVVSLPPIMTSSMAVPDMFEPDSKTRQQIYGRGRSQYLRTRLRHRPESRYAFPVVSSYEYGWRLGDVIATDEMRNPPHGRCRIVADTFYRRNGLPQLG